MEDKKMNPTLFEFAGEVSELIGTLLIAYAALSVHHRFRHEHKVDEEVFTAMRSEIVWAFIGIALILIGFGLHTFGRYVLA
jgi:hypothetical protein